MIATKTKETFSLANYPQTMHRIVNVAGKLINPRCFYLGGSH